MSLLYKKYLCELYIVSEIPSFCNMSRAKREEAKINAWENLQKAKAEAAIRKLEVNFSCFFSSWQNFNRILLLKIFINYLKIKIVTISNLML